MIKQLQTADAIAGGRTRSAGLPGLPGIPGNPGNPGGPLGPGRPPVEVQLIGL